MMAGLFISWSTSNQNRKGESRQINWDMPVRCVAVRVFFSFFGETMNVTTAKVYCVFCGRTGECEVRARIVPCASCGDRPVVCESCSEVLSIGDHCRWRTTEKKVSKNGGNVSGSN